MMSYEDIRTKLIARKPVFFENTLEEIAIKAQPTEGEPQFFARPRHRAAYPIKHSTKVVTEGLLEGKEITEDEYENY